MTERREGGSQMTVSTRNRKEGPDRQADAYSRAIALLGEETVKKIRRDWDTGYGGKEWTQSEGVVLQLLQQGLSQRVIKTTISVRGTSIVRLRNMLKLGIEIFHTRRERLKPWHAFSEENLAAFKAHCLTWILEDGFPCVHDSTSRSQS
ncbi:hypothetical protein GQ600_8601 [Phytophthora cactorum]|nr:hypothetical protein GQ600_8601 [Phytophthora cactorum]